MSEVRGYIVTVCRFDFGGGARDAEETVEAYTAEDAYAQVGFKLAISKSKDYATGVRPAGDDATQRAKEDLARLDEKVRKLTYRVVAIEDAPFAALKTAPVSPYAAHAFEHFNPPATRDDGWALCRHCGFTAAEGKHTK